MSVRLNEVALQRLLESRTGPVGQDLEERAEKVAQALQARVDRILVSSPFKPQVGFEIDSDAQGLVARVGIPNEGRLAEYVDSKIAREGQQVQALQEGMK